MLPSPAQLAAEFSSRFGAPPALLARAPGRVNLLGEHIDYNAGPVLPAAIDREVWLAVAPNQQGIVRLAARDLGKQASFQPDTLSEKVDAQGKKLPGWVLYPAGVAWSLQSAGLSVLGMDALYTSNVPIGSGLSSSAAVEVAFASAWQALGGWKVEPMTLAQLCQRAENQYIGIQSGLMDQFASVHGVAGHALYFDTRDLSWKALPLPANTALVVADSGIRRSLSNSAYNERQAACVRAVELLQQYLPNIQTLRDVEPAEFAAYSAFLPEEVRKRAEHVVKEIARVGTAVTALRRGERRAFGALMFAGHASLRDLYEVSLPELDALVEIARQLPGCFGARLTGAGFGGCTINLVEESQAPEFIQGLQAAYAEKTGKQAQVYLCRASAGASVQPF
jgi:galactokinase